MAKGKVILWMGSAYGDLNSMPSEARRQLGHQLGLVQLGQTPYDWKPFESVGPGAKEIRVRIDGNQYRSIYVAKFEDAVYVLHCFVKRRRRHPDMTSRSRGSGIGKS